MTSIEEIPAELMRAIEHASRILNWQENLGEDEMPPAWMWVYEDELSSWFDEVTRRRNEKFSSGSGSDDDPNMMSNEYARGRG